MAGRLQGGVAHAIALECRTRAVELVAVELDDEVVVRPEGVDLMAGDQDVDLRGGQAGVAAEVEEAALEH